MRNPTNGGSNKLRIINFIKASRPIKVLGSGEVDIEEKATKLRAGTIPHISLKVNDISKEEKAR